MNAIQQRCRPKHQVLVLKCYPRTTKGAVDVKPNSSELSYLLFYATSRRSKIQKIGSYLERKTASDVWRQRIGNVQVTLGILAALLEKSPKDAALVSPYVLKILDIILRSADITMIESSLPTFASFCDNHDASSLFADQAYLSQYESVIRSYAHLASTRATPGKAPVSRPLQLRWRSAGLQAVKSIASSDALSSATGRQIGVIVPVILENLWTDNLDFLEVLTQRVQVEEKVDAESLLKRRTSVGTVRTVDTAGDTNPVALSGSAGDVDKMAEEDIGVLAMQCLKLVFVVPNRPQMYAATGAFLKFTQERVSQGEEVVTMGENRKTDSGWAIKMYRIVAGWAPVQDRYVILLMAMENLAKTPMKDGHLEQHMAVVAMIGSLLRSDANLIGLSVMDVLLGLVRQMRRLIQLPSDGSRSGSLNDEKAGVEAEREVPPRDRLLDRLERCVGDLATHVYYADQITDMIAAILARLKPNRTASTTSTPQAEKNDDNEHGPNSSLPDLSESQSHIDTYFSYSTGRISGLRVIRAILLVANPKTRITGNMNLSRNRVPIQVWDGTHWLLRDPNGQVRKAYVDALATWLDRETTFVDARARDDAVLAPRSSLNDGHGLLGIARRAVSNASNRERQLKGRRSQFLPLLHLAIYDNALQFVDCESDLVLLHILLTKLTFKLGVNAARYGIPMIYRLQEDVQEAESPVHKVRIAALCHGYFWALSEAFDFEASVVGRAIHNEISRRESKGFWVDNIHVPTPLMSTVRTPGSSGPQPAWDLSALQSEELLPFDDRTSLVECIAAHYEESTRSPPSSPAVSPGRSISTPLLGSALSAAPLSSGGETELPSSIREQMLTEWSRESVVAALSSEGKSESLSGSKTGTNRQRLAVQTAGLNGNNIAPASPFGSLHNLRPQSAHVHGDRLASVTKMRKSSVRSGVSGSAMSARGGVASVEQLKMVLSGAVSPQALGLTAVDDDSGDSMVSYDYTASELSSNPPPTQPEQGLSSPDMPKRSLSAARNGPLTSNPPHEASPMLDDTDEAEVDDDAPPMPPIPNSFSASGLSERQKEVSIQDHALRPARRNIGSRAGESMRQSSLRSRGGDGSGSGSGSGGLDLQELLRGIDSRPSEGSLGNVTRPPY